MEDLWRVGTKLLRCRDGVLKNLFIFDHSAAIIRIIEPIQVGLSKFKIGNSLMSITNAGGNVALDHEVLLFFCPHFYLQDGIILGADTRATEGPIVADKNCEKIHYMAPNIYCCGAGTAADTEAVTDMVSSQLLLHRYATGRESRVAASLTLLKTHLFGYQGHVSAALVLGGVDITGPHLYTIYPHGSTDSLPFATMGSGSLAAMAMFETKYKEGLTREEGISLVCEAICSGIFNDLGSGSNVDVCVITKGHKEYLRNYQLPNPRTYVSLKGYSFVKGQTEVLSTKITPLKNDMVTVAEGEAMEE
ncbi:hypothetical protein GIB67_011904 [Kingdonia uniflora]|uniref:proteasome endopeptidase complex n=1 Tax=Kingdonia uniflora TaxID=39325 RepID=A0A7J7LZU1_9MAGN|nr:hypothetical protein GIB67_011904 [Kingdonia uniflora]